MSYTVHYIRILSIFIRSPSPEPIYSTDGKRLNTREFRARKKLEDDRHDCVQAALAINPEYKAPMDYKLVLVYQQYM